MEVKFLINVSSLDNLKLSYCICAVIFVHHFRALHLTISIQLNTSFNEIQSKKTWFKLCDFTDCVPA